MTDSDETVIRFAQRHEEFCEVSLGDCPEDGSPTYYLYHNGTRHPFHMDDHVSHLYLVINDGKFRANVLIWPSHDRQPFHGETIWRASENI